MTWDVPYFFVGNDAFALATWLMKPFPLRLLTSRQRIFNYRLSRARRISENGFGILAGRFRCLTTTLGVAPKTAKTVVKTTLTLHNLIRLRHPQLQPGEVDREDNNGNIVPGAWRDGIQLTDNDNLAGNRGMRQAKVHRNYLMDFYNSPAGAVPWQNRIDAIRPQGPDSDHESESEVD